MERASRDDEPVNATAEVASSAHVSPTESALRWLDAPRSDGLKGVGAVGAFRQAAHSPNAPLPRLELGAKANALTGAGEAAAPAGPAQPQEPGLLDKIGSAVTGGADALSAAVGDLVVRHHTIFKAPGGSSDRTIVGVGETIVFTSNMKGKWKATQTGNDNPKSMSGTEYRWRAMATKGSAKVTFEAAEKGHAPIETQITVLEPIVDYINPTMGTFPKMGPGVSGVVMDTNIHYSPNTVSFANTTFWEKPGPATNPSHYFTVPAHGPLPHHDPTVADKFIYETNEGPTDSAGWWGLNGPYDPGGTFDWVIPTYYSIIDESGGHLLIRNVTQRCTLAADGTMTVSKGTATMSRKP